MSEIARREQNGRVLSILPSDEGYLIVNEDDIGRQSAVLTVPEMIWLVKTFPWSDHPAGCFYGSFGGYDEDHWHIPAGVICPLDHGTDPIQLESAERHKGV